MKRRIICIILLLTVFTCVQQFLLSAHASDGGTSAESQISDEFLAGFANDGERHVLLNMYSGEELVYDKDTDLDDLRRVYTAGSDAEELQPVTIPPDDPQYYDILTLFNESGYPTATSSSVSYNYKAHTPYSAVCLIEFTYRYKGKIDNGYATGFVIGESQIATSGHLIVMLRDLKSSGNLLSSVSLYLPLKGARGDLIIRKYTMQSGECSTQAAAYHYDDDDSFFIPPDVDYGIMNIVGNLGLHGIFKLGNGTNIGVGTEAMLVGYDGGVARENMKNDQSFLSLPISTSEGTAYEYDNEYIKFAMNSAKGQSGSPIFLVKDDYLEVIAILSAGGENITAGKRISSTVYSFYQARISIEDVNDYIKNIEIDQPNYYSGEEIRVHVFKVPTQTAWVGLYKRNVTDYPNNATGMWRYLENNSKDTPTSFNNRKDVTITLTANIHDITYDIYHALPNGPYKIVLFRDNGYKPIVYIPFNVGGSSITSVNYNGNTFSAYYKGTCHTNAWIGIYHNTDTYGPGHPSIAWKYLPLSSSMSNYVEFSANLSPGTYKAILFADGDYVALYTYVFTVS